MEKLNLTPEQILDTEFKVDFKGYDAAQVDLFLDLILEDYQIMESNIKELSTYVEELQSNIRDLKKENFELQGRAKAFDISNTTTYSSVDLLKRISRIEEELYRK